MNLETTNYLKSIHNNPEIFKPNKNAFIVKEQEEKKDYSDKRFKVIVTIIILLFLSSHITKNDTQTFWTFNYAISFAVWIWLITDYKLLQNNRLFIGALGLSILILLYGIYLEKSGVTDNGTKLPIIFLIIQRLLRLGFLSIMKREPIVDKPAPSFIDFIYMMILIIAPLLVSFLILK